MKVHIQQACWRSLHGAFYKRCQKKLQASRRLHSYAECVVRFCASGRIQVQIRNNVQAESKGTLQTVREKLAWMLGHEIDAKKHLQDPETTMGHLYFGVGGWLNAKNTYQIVGSITTQCVCALQAQLEARP